mgnify:CR=1 FL=1
MHFYKNLREVSGNTQWFILGVLERKGMTNICSRAVFHCDGIMDNEFNRSGLDHLYKYISGIYLPALMTI